MTYESRSFRPGLPVIIIDPEGAAERQVWLRPTQLAELWLEANVGATAQPVRQLQPMLIEAA